MMDGSLPDAAVGRLRDAFWEVIASLPGRFPSFQEGRFSADLVNLWEQASDLNVAADLVEVERLAHVPHEFVPGTGADYDSDLWPPPGSEVLPFGELIV